MGKTYRAYLPEQKLLLPPSLQDWLPENHLVYFVNDLVDQLDLSAIEKVYEREQRGQRAREAGAKDRSVYCRPETPARTRGVAAAGADPEQPHASGADGAQVTDESGSEHIRATQRDRGADLRTDQAGPRDSPISVTRVEESAGRMGLGVSDAQYFEDARARCRGVMEKNRKRGAGEAYRGLWKPFWAAGTVCFCGPALDEPSAPARR